MSEAFNNARIIPLFCVQDVLYAELQSTEAVASKAVKERDASVEELSKLKAELAEFQEAQVSIVFCIICLQTM